MDNDHVYDGVARVIIERCGVPPETVRPESRLVEDLELDSIDAVEIAMRLEQDFNIRIDERESQEAQTVGEVAELVERRIAQRI